MTAHKAVSTAIVSESLYSNWNTFVVGACGGSPYASTEYLSILCSASGGNFKVIGAFISDELVGGIALYESRSRYGICAAPRLLLYYHGLVLKRGLDTSTQIGVLTALIGELSKIGYARITIANSSEIQDVRPFLAAGWTPGVSYSYVVPLTKEKSALTGFDKNLRRLVRRAEDAGVTVGQDSDFESFFVLHNEIHERKGAHLYLERKPFERYMAALVSSGLGRLFHARMPGGQACATQLVLAGAHPITHTICAGSSKESLSMGVTPLLRAKVFEALSNQGYQGNDLTDAALNTITQFKSHLGGSLVMNLSVDKIFSRTLKARIAVKQIFKR